MNMVSSISTLQKKYFVQKISSHSLNILIDSYGGIREISTPTIKISQFPGNAFESSPAALYLRILADNNIIRVFDLLHSPVCQKVAIGDCAAQWNGQTDRFTYRLNLSVHDDGWDWRLSLKRRKDCPAFRYDLVLVQDVALALPHMVSNNNYYACQYLDHHVTVEDSSAQKFLWSRQNLPQQNKNPLLMSGHSGGVRLLMTDGEQFYGPTSRFTMRPEGLWTPEPQGGILQRECALHVLYSPWKSLDDEDKAHFFHRYWPHWDEPVSGSSPLFHLDQQAQNTFPKRKVVCEFVPAENPFHRLGAIAGEVVDDGILENVYPADQRINPEYDPTGRLLSFFTRDKHHVVCAEKERQMVKSHGHILHTVGSMQPDENALSCTAWANGVFFAHLSVGNPTMNRLLPIYRSPWGFSIANGARLLVREGKQNWQLLTEPSWLELNPDAMQWHYLLGNGLSIRVKTQALSGQHQIELTVETDCPELELQLLVFIESDVQVATPANTIFTLKPSSSHPASRTYPELLAKISVLSHPMKAELLLTEDDRSAIVLSFRQQLHLSISGRSTTRFPAKGQQSTSSISSLNGEITGNPSDEWQAMTSILPWFSHNARIHYLKPFGLEQFSGGGWGTRDVCQGPVEYLLANHEFTTLRWLITTIYSHQYLETGDWPQAFRFDAYGTSQHGNSHGDIVYWPLKALCDYVMSTNDTSILEETAGYYSIEGQRLPDRSESILQHIDRQIDCIVSQFFPGVQLPAYGHGDWNDSMQPANSTLAESLVSCWTAALAYQQLSRWGVILDKLKDASRSRQIRKLTDGIRESFQQHLLVAGDIPGYALFRAEDSSFQPVIHPSIPEQKPQHRLLPCIRAIIAGLLSSRDAQSQAQRIKHHLQAPDGIRLYECPIPYSGGKMARFQRAETATFFGREIGLLYIHAQLRYAEAMAISGDAEAFWKAMRLANPINIDALLPKSSPRQANTYFSSSDALFSDRYQAQEKYQDFLAGKIPVTGGWRIYSSGPGIWLRLWHDYVQGIRFHFDHVEIDPVIPARLTPCTIKFSFGNTTVNVTHHCPPLEASALTINGERIDARRHEDNPYRAGGFRVPRDQWNEYCEHGTVNIELE